MFKPGPRPLAQERFRNRNYLHPDLVGRVAAEAAKTAESFLTMCIRAVDYLPPVDITFGDYLRALVTADRELIAIDRLDQRGALIEAFRQRGIYPESVVSLAEESVMWSPAPPRIPPVPVLSAKLAQLVSPAVTQSSPTTASALTLPDQGQVAIDPRQAKALHQYANQHRAALHLAPKLKIWVQGFHFLFRVGQDGRPDFELVAQFVQSDGRLLNALGGIPFRGGTTIIAEADGSLKYVIAKPVGDVRAARKAAEERLEKQRAFAQECAANDPMFSWHPRIKQYERKHMAARMNLARVHRGV